MSLILALPRLLWDFRLKPSLGCEGRLRACGLRPTLPFLSLAKGAEVKVLVCTFTSALPRTRRARRDQREQQAPPGWWVAVLIREGACLRGLCWAPKVKRPPQPPDRTLTVYVEAFTGSSQHVVQCLLSASLSQGCIPETASTVGTMGRPYF